MNENVEQIAKRNEFRELALAVLLLGLLIVSMF